MFCFLLMSFVLETLICFSQVDNFRKMTDLYHQQTNNVSPNLCCKATLTSSCISCLSLLHTCEKNYKEFKENEHNHFLIYLFKGAQLGIDDTDESTFTISCDQKTFHFQGMKIETSFLYMYRSKPYLELQPV